MSAQHVPAKTRPAVAPHFTASLSPGPDETLVTALYKQIPWTMVDVEILDKEGAIVFSQQGILAPTFWSQRAVTVAAQKYFYGHVGDSDRENSIWSLVRRVASTIALGARDQGLIDDDELDLYDAELTYLLIHQRMAFNSPVWFNVGIYPEPQSSACFIQSVGDSIPKIMELATSEAVLFKAGSGTGTNLSTLRGSHEPLTGGGRASGPVSFARGLDTMAGAIKSGGKTRRAAKMVLLNVSHPDVVEFIDSKATAERQAHALVDAGFDPSFDAADGAYAAVNFQNANHSVRLSDAFMDAVVEDASWALRNVTDGEVCATVNASDLLMRMAEAAHLCGDPGAQYSTTINDWHTCSNTAPINASNPCSEFMFLDNTSCDLASINLLPYSTSDGIDVEDFVQTVSVAVIGMEALIGFSGYPTERLAVQTRRFRPIGLGYANLGALLMVKGLAYDSLEGRKLAGDITSLMTACAYTESANMAARVGPFDGYDENREPFARVIAKHLEHAARRRSPLGRRAYAQWQIAQERIDKNGARNGQATVLAPTGTIAFLMDCQTTGIEPENAHVKFKQLVGGGVFKMVSELIAPALENLGYTETEIEAIIAHLMDKETIEGAPGLHAEHLPVFDCAFVAENGTRSITYQGHLNMMAEVQPFLSGAISKTVNLPSDATPDDFYDIFVTAWLKKLKAVAVYRYGCKRSQPLSVSAQEASVDQEPKDVMETDPGLNDAERALLADFRARGHRKAPPQFSWRNRLPTDRAGGSTHKFKVGGMEGYLTPGEYPSGELGEILSRMSLAGAPIDGIFQCFLTAVSVGLQHGVPLEVFANKFIGTSFEPSGFTGHPEIPHASSIADYIFRFLMKKYSPELKTAAMADAAVAVQSVPQKPAATDPSKPPCAQCGYYMTPNGACMVCPNCGETTGCG